jgi:serine-type D-Ala-D-Ala carboxypeptidase (penicillin-binding protein 5/6)
MGNRDGGCKDSHHGDAETRSSTRRKRLNGAFAILLGLLCAVSPCLPGASSAWAQSPLEVDAAVRMAPVATPELDEEGMPIEDGEDAAPEKESAPRDPSAPLEVKAPSAILVDARTGTVLWERNARERRPIASTTKIMTATILLERTRPEEIVTASKTACATQYANLHLRPGEKLTMRDLLYAIMLRSANDGCVAAAEHVAGSEAAFVRLMNEKARELGAVDTHFVTCNGLYHPDHYSTASDLARIAVYAVQNPQFNALCGTPARTISRSIATKDVLLRNHNKLLHRYPGADGIKTGYVHQSGRCLVASASRPEGGQPWRLIAVVLHSPNTYGDCAALLDYGFSHFQPLLFARRGEQVGMALVQGGVPPEVPALAQADIFAVVPRGTYDRRPRTDDRQDLGFAVAVGGGRSAASRPSAVVPATERRVTLASLKAPVRRDQPIGTLSGLVDGRVEAAGALIAGAAARPDWLSSAGGFCGRGCAGVIALIFIAWGPRYARALTKGPRRRRRRLPAGSRRPDYGRPRDRRRPGDHRAWDEG